MIDILKECLRKEAEALIEVSQNIDESFIEFAEDIAECKGKIFFTGVGKSFLVASKIAETFSSIGISSIPLNPLSILHGDLGALNKNDIVIALSNSGETDILKDAWRYIHSAGIKTNGVVVKKETVSAVFHNGKSILL